MNAFDLAVIGAGPAGTEAAVWAARTGARVALIDPDGVGGTMLWRSTIPSKALQAAALRHATPLGARDAAIAASAETLRGRVEGSGVTRIVGRAHFLNPHTLEVVGPSGESAVRADRILIATGSHPQVPSWIPEDPTRVHDSDSILTRETLPESLTVIGSGVVACELASIFQALNVPVTLVNPFGRPPLDGAVEDELRGAFLEAFEGAGGRYVAAPLEVVELDDDGVVTVLGDADEIVSDALLVCAPRAANLEGLSLDAAGLSPNDRRLLAVDENYRTDVEHIYGAGDVIGPPGLASTGMEQGRLAAHHALGLSSTPPQFRVPLGIFTIPEIASVGLTEAKARSKHGEVCVGRARFADVARGALDASAGGPSAGLLKLVADLDGRLVGVQAVGSGATELVHVGLMALVAGLRVETFVETVFNYPTRAETYRLAALEILHALRARRAA